MNNAHLKLNSMSEFTTLWNSGEKFRKFAEQVYRYLERMKPGTVLVLERYSGMDHQNGMCFYPGRKQRFGV